MEVSGCHHVLGSFGAQRGEMNSLLLQTSVTDTLNTKGRKPNRDSKATCQVWDRSGATANPPRTNSCLPHTPRVGTPVAAVDR